MNSLNLDNYMKAGKGIVMSYNNKAIGREALIALMREKPLPRVGIMESWQALFQVYRPVFSLLSIVLLIFLSYAGAARAAINSLPGNGLYSFKTNVDEELRGAMIFSYQDKAEWAIERMGRRIEEGEALHNEGRFSGAALGEIEDKASKHVAEIGSIIADFRARNDYEKAKQIMNRFDEELAKCEEIGVKMGPNNKVIFVVRESSEQKPDNAAVFFGKL